MKLDRRTFVKSAFAAGVFPCFAGCASGALAKKWAPRAFG